MKKIILLLFVLLFTTSAFSQGILTLIGRSEDFFKLLSDQKLTEAYGYLDEDFQLKVTQQNFNDIWAKLNEKLGKLQTLQVTSSKKEGEFFIIVVEAKFTNDTQSFLLAYNKDEKMTGFYAQPKSSEASYMKPAYADTSLYKETEIYVKTPKHNLVGVLTQPKSGSNFPVVVLVHDLGAQDMDGTLGPNKPLKDLAGGLASKGIATIRYVKRTMVYLNEFEGAFTVKEEIVDDALAAIALAKTIPSVNKKQIYLLGHSFGGMLAPRIVLQSPDLKGILLLAAPARKLTDELVDQNKYFFALQKDTTNAAKMQIDSLIKDLDQSRITKLGNLKPDSLLFGVPASYWVDLNLYDQVGTVKKLVTQRIFIAQGANDFQIPASDYDIWNTALGKKRNVTLKLYPELNHMFSPQKEKGDMKQYQVQANVSEALITDISAWIKAK